MKKLLLLITFAIFAISIGCAKKDDNNAHTYALNYNNQCIDQTTGQMVAATLCQNAYNTGYTYGQNGQCYSTTTGQPAPIQYCQQTTNTGYTYGQNGQCYSTTTGQPAPIQYCQQTTNTGYTYGQNGQCYSTTTGQPAPIQYCQQNGSGGVMSQPCFGTYYYNGQAIGCGTQYNCSGAIVTTTYGQQVRCQ